MMDPILTADKRATCAECQNDFDVSDKKIGEVVECPHCGIEYEVTGENDGEMELIMVEEEK